MKHFLYSIATDKRKDPIAWLAGIFLFLVSLLYGIAVKLILIGYKIGIIHPKKLNVPVISIGNLTLGGVGKTPMVILIAKMLKDQKLKPVILTRGYAKQNDLSDEAELLRQLLGDIPVVVNPDRYQGGLEAIEKYAPDVILLDDGFQHWRLFRDLDIVLIDSVNPFGNEHLLPRGILREPLASLRRAEVIVLTKTNRGDVGRLHEKLKSLHPTAVVVQTVHKPTGIADIFTRNSFSLTRLNQSVVAFCGIGEPLSFRSSLASLGVDVKEFVSFPDHHPYSQKDMERLKEMCATIGIKTLVTTQKDAVKLDVFRNFWQGFEIFSLNIEMEITQGKHEFVDRISRLSRR